jgi:hypothetical protein
MKWEEEKERKERKKNGQEGEDDVKDLRYTFFVKRTFLLFLYTVQKTSPKHTLIYIYHTIQTILYFMVRSFFLIMYFSYLKGPPPHPYAG